MSGPAVAGTTASLPLRGLVAACHPGPTAVVTGLAAALAVGVGAPVATVLLVTSAVLAGQLSVGWSNDWVDAPRDLAVDRTGKPVVSGQVGVGQLRTAALAAAAGTVVLSLATGWLPGAVHLVAVAMAWAYNLRLKSTLLSWLPYAVSFGLLAVFVVLALPGRPLVAGWAVAAAALLGVGAHLANVLPDLEDDGRTGVHGLPHRLGRRGTGLAAPAVLLAGVVVATWGPAVAGASPGPLRLALALLAAVLAVTAGVVGTLAPVSRLPFTLSMAVAALSVVMLVGSGRALVGV